MTSKEFLAHHGREGMKWYQHIFGKFQEHAKYNKGGEKSISRSERSLSENLSTRKIKKISTEELKDRISRLKVEKEYIDLSKETRTKGKIITDKILDSFGDTSLNIIKKSIENLGQQYVTYFLGTKINKKAGADIVNPKKGQKDK